MAAPDAPTVRRADPADAEPLAGITARAYAAAYPGIVPAPVLDEWIADAPQFWEAVFAQQTADSPSRAWVAARGGTVLGYATTAPGKDWWLPPRDAAGELTNLYLDPAAIGSGVGGLLYRHAVADLRERGFNPFVVWAFRDNPRAIGFYEAMGLAIDVSDHTWELGGVACPIVRFRTDWS